MAATAGEIDTLIPIENDLNVKLMLLQQLSDYSIFKTVQN